jgi:hypothetical protein
VRIGGPGINPGVRYLLETARREREKNWTDATHILMASSARGGAAGVAGFPLDDDLLSLTANAYDALPP